MLECRRTDPAKAGSHAVLGSRCVALLAVADLGAAERDADSSTPSKRATRRPCPRFSGSASTSTARKPTARRPCTGRSGRTISR